MGINPFAALSAPERATYRTALTGHVVEVMYRAWQRGTTMHIQQIVNEVQGLTRDDPFIEIHRTVALMEGGGLIRQEPAGSVDAGLWVWLDAPRAPIPSLQFCATPGCLRPDGHVFGHLPDLHAVHLNTELVVTHDDFVAAWANGSPWVRIYSDGAAWSANAEPTNVLVVPHTTPYVPDALAALVTDWLGTDEHPGREQNPHVISAGVDTGTLQHRHPRYFAVWHHGEPTIEIHSSPLDWDTGKDPIIRVDVPDDAPFTGLVLAQAAEDWWERAGQRDQDTPASEPDSAPGNPITTAYFRHGLPSTTTAEQRAAWGRHLDGQAVPLQLLPTNGDRCAAQTHSPVGCGFPLLIDGSCPNSDNHTDNHTDGKGSL